MYTESVATKIDQAVLITPVYFYAIDEERSGVILTPACDLEHSKAELVQVCALFNAVDLIAELLRTDWVKMGLVDEVGERIRGPLSASKKGDLTHGINNLIGQRIPRFHWLAPLPGSGSPLIADFQVLASVPVSELGSVTILGSLVSPFREQIAARYAAYMGRVGTPDFEKAEIDDWINFCLDSLFTRRPAG